MKIHRVKFEGPWAQTCLMFMTIGLIDIIQGLIMFFSLGTVVLRNENYYGVLPWGERKLRTWKEKRFRSADTHKTKCDCPGCLFLKHTGKPLTEENLRQVIDGFQANNAPLEELQAFLTKVGIEVNVMEIPGSPPPPSNKEDIFH